MEYTQYVKYFFVAGAFVALIKAGDTSLSPEGRNRLMQAAIAMAVLANAF